MGADQRLGYGILVEALPGHVCVDHREVRGRDADAMSGELDPQSTAKLLDRCLAHRVRDGAGPVDEREHRRDQYEPTTVFDEARKGSTDRVERTLDVHVEESIDHRSR
nr:hypothetical protein [Streptomyces sp. NBC_01373]